MPDRYKLVQAKGESVYRVYDADPPQYRGEPQGLFEPGLLVAKFWYEHDALLFIATKAKAAAREEAMSDAN